MPRSVRRSLEGVSSPARRCPPTVGRIALPTQGGQDRSAYGEWAAPSSRGTTPRDSPQRPSRPSLWRTTRAAAEVSEGRVRMRHDHSHPDRSRHHPPPPSPRRPLPARLRRPRGSLQGHRRGLGGRPLQPVLRPRARACRGRRAPHHPDHPRRRDDPTHARGRRPRSRPPLLSRTRRPVRRGRTEPDPARPHQDRRHLRPRRLAKVLAGHLRHPRRPPHAGAAIPGCRGGKRCGRAHRRS